MCGRYISPDEAALERHWGLKQPPNFFQSYNVAPSQSAPVIRRNEADNLELGMLIWSFQPDWAKRGWINARSETVFESKAFGSSCKKRRCLVPATGWYEWQGAKSPKQPYVFHLGDFKPIAFAGIWTSRKTPEGWLPSYAILTRAAESSVKNIHDRMPVVLRSKDYEIWTDPHLEIEAAKELLRARVDPLHVYPISTYVNKPANNGPQCIERINAARP
jgi:putative SOS response-associated peptidase YedK